MPCQDGPTTRGRSYSHQLDPIKPVMTLWSVDGKEQVTCCQARRIGQHVPEIKVRIFVEADGTKWCKYLGTGGSWLLQSSALRGYLHDMLRFNLMGCFIGKHQYICEAES